MSVSQSSPKVEARPDYLEELTRHYKQRLLAEADVESITHLPSEEMRAAVQRIISHFMAEDRLVLPRRDREELIGRILNESVGLGPLEELLADPNITEILVNGPESVFIERYGRLEAVAVRFRDENHLRQIVDRIVAPIGRRVDESSPMVDARLPDGSRVHVVIPPVSLTGTTISIRRFPAAPYTMENLVRFGSMSDEMATFMQATVRARMNVLLSGGTGSGKTTLLNALSQAIPEAERVITVEDMAELRLLRRHVVSMESRPANVEGTGAIGIRDLVRNALRMRPDRIIVGAVRGPEAFDMLQAMNTGHEGSLTTLHANSVPDAIRRLESMVIMAGTGLPSAVIREYIYSALDLIVQIGRLEDGTRKVLSISEVQKGEDGTLDGLREIFHFVRSGVRQDRTVVGRYGPTGLLPRCLDRFSLYGVRVPDSLFIAPGDNEAGDPGQDGAFPARRGSPRAEETLR